MVLNYIWIGFFLIAFIIAALKLVFMGDYDVFPAMMDSTFSSSKTAFEISLGLTGVLSLWLGVMKVGEKGGVVNVLARVLAPIFTKLFPDIPKGHPVTGSIFMNIAANMLGLDNAATPLGLKAMEQMQELNTKKDTASNSMIMFLVLNTSGLTLIPVSIMVYRAQMNATQPTDIFIPILLATFFSTLAGIIITSFYQRINLNIFRSYSFHRRDNTAQNMINAVVLPRILNGHDVLHVFHHADGSMIAPRGTANRANLGVRNIMARAAIKHLFFEARECHGKCLHIFIRLTQEMQHQTQSGPPSHTGKRSHLIYRLF